MRIAIPPAASKLSVTLSVIGSTGLTTNSSKDVNVTDLGWADDDGEFDEDPATMFD